MATVTGLTAARMLAIEAESVVNAHLTGDNLILVRHDASTIDVGSVRGATGVPGPANSGDLIGAIVAYGGASAPTGWLLCDGASYPRADHPDLFTAIGTAYGSADSLHFNVPDLIGKFPRGKTAAGTGSTLGGTGGSNDSIAVSHSHNHTHSISNDGTHKHGVGGFPADNLQIVIKIGSSSIQWTGGGADPVTYTKMDDAGNHGHGGATGADNTAAGASGVDANIPPYAVVNYLIRRG